MKGVTSWSFAPYRPPMFDVGDIYICRLYPGAGKIGMDWLPLDGADAYTVHLRLRDSDDEWSVREVQGTSCVWDGLADMTDYEFYVSAGEKKSRVRLARTGDVPGDYVVNYLHPEDEVYSFSGHSLCSPSFVRHPDGYLLASMDVFASRHPQCLELIFRSDDDGATWKYVSELYPCFWGKMFIHRGDLYMLAVSTEYGDLLIGKSTDGGKTFGVPTVLLRGTSGFEQKGVHKNPQPVIEYGGRIWNTLEWGSWASGGHAAMLASAPADADLLDAGSWLFSPPVPYDPAWQGTVEGPSRGCIEGCLTAAPDGQLYNVMRYQTDKCTPEYGRVIVMKVFPDEPERPQEFERVIDFPGNHSKFVILHDEVSGLYLSLVSYLTEENAPRGRNRLALIASDDLWRWRHVYDVYNYLHMDPAEIGFQYIDLMIEGDDLLFLSRTAWNGARNYHDANFSVFSRIRNFRDLL
ncbi:MAG: exo-alpha-sialidase [Ruminococcaceae bacterium]|nr:exo-alpha-sialidase [Oscillospiraceae bacterium]